MSSKVGTADKVDNGGECKTFVCYKPAMARRIELKGICNDLLSKFISRNNDLDGFWTLGQCRVWLKECQKSAIQVSLVGKAASNDKPQVAAISQHFSVVIATMLSNHKLNADWLKNGSITIECMDSEKLRCSIILISDLGRMFQSTRTLAVRCHDPDREFRRHSDSREIRYQLD